MDLGSINSKIKEIENESQRSLFVLSGLTSSISGSSNRINAFHYNLLKETLNSPINQAKFRDVDCDLIITSAGGCLSSAIAITQLLYSRFGQINIIVPTMASSSASLMSFSATNLYVCPESVTSDFIHNVKIAKELIPSVIEHCIKLISKGLVVDRSQIIKFILLNYMLRHEPITFKELQNCCAESEVFLKDKSLEELGLRDKPETQIESKIHVKYKELDKIITNYLITNNLSSLMLCSDVSHMALT